MLGEWVKLAKRVDSNQKSIDLPTNLSTWDLFKGSLIENMSKNT